VLPPSAEPAATGTSPRSSSFIERTDRAGHAYAAAADVYFDVLSYGAVLATLRHRVDDVHRVRVSPR